MQVFRILLPTLILAAAIPASAQSNPNGVSEDIRLRAVAAMRDSLQNEEKWVKVHAAEHLLALRYTEGVREEFEKELEQHGNEPQYRIGIWRVLARAATSPEDYNHWIDLIRAARSDANGPDRLHATETLGKLNYAATPDEIASIEADAQSPEGPMAAYASLLLVHSGRPEFETRLINLLASGVPLAQQCAAYSLRHIAPIRPDSLAALEQAADAAGQDSPARVYILSAIAWHTTSPVVLDTIKPELVAYATTGATGQKTEALAALGERGATDDLALTVPLLDDPDADVRAAAAHATLRIGRRAPHLLAMLDWAVIALYFALMIGVGVYYARRTATQEDYMLGGRTMNPITVGFSMFASLLSTLTYLSLPGEMVKHGPMIISQYFAWPFIFIVIGFVIIPVIKRQDVSSAYEILEKNLGTSARVTGAAFFLLLRFMWMALIVYATSSKVLVPLLQLDQAYTPLICIVLAAITISYTSLGGIRAVVMSDVIQTAVLFGGAILTILMITYQMGGVGAWWPTEWPVYWDPIVVTLDPNARITIAGAMMSAFVWYVCTAGSDQVAVQRYLATRDVKSARRVMATSLTTDILVGVFLATLGIALASFFHSNPQMLPDNYSSLQNADTLFPRFISLGLPAGVSGLVIAGLLAAAMSSLSSGVNSASLVISVDFIERFGKPDNAGNEARNVRRARWVSLFVGVCVILLSLCAGTVAGNLLEVVYKVANLLVAPLFVLFFMALFVPWANARGAIAAALCSAAMAASIAYGNFLGLSFIWMMPLSLVTGILVGPIISAVWRTSKLA